MVTLISDYRCHEFAQTLPQIRKGYTINTLDTTAQSGVGRSVHVFCAPHPGNVSNLFSRSIDSR